MAGFIFDFAGIEAVLADWARLKDDLLADANMVSPLGVVEGPGDEPASNRIAGAARTSEEVFLAHNSLMREIVDSYISRLTAARDAYLTLDEHGRNSFTAGR